MGANKAAVLSVSHFVSVSPPSDNCPRVLEYAQVTPVTGHLGFSETGRL